jgi:phosphodiesterase/alkaline phosphatase D-like protein
VDHIAADAIDDVTFVTGDIHTFFAGDITRTGRQTVRGEDRVDQVSGPSHATEFVGGAIASPGIVDRAASTETERVAAAAPADAAVLADNAHLAYANQAYKGYCILEAGAGRSTSATRRSTSSATPTPGSSPCAASAWTPGSRWSSTRVVRCRREPGGPPLERLHVGDGQPGGGIGADEQGPRGSLGGPGPA